MKPSDRDKTLYESWVRAHGGDVYRCAQRLCGHADTAEELTQEVFYEAWRGIGSLRELSKARVWLLGILRHRYMHWLRDQKRRPRSGVGADAKAAGVRSDADTPQEVLERQEALQAALNELNDRYKVPFLLVFLEGLTCQEAADFLDVPLGTILSRIHRARQFLRENLQDEEARDSGHLRIRHDQADPGSPPRSVGGAS